MAAGILSPNTATQSGNAENAASMAVVNTELLGVMIQQTQKMLDPESRAKAMQQAADETNQALSKANDALQTGQVTLELAKDVAPVMEKLTEVNLELTKVVAKLELMDQRLQAVEAKGGGCCTVS